MNKLLTSILIIVTLLIISYSLNICPPSGPWPMPPWCGINNLSSEKGLINNYLNLSENFKKSSNNEYFITHYLNSSVEIIGRISFYNITDLPLSITTLAWGLSIPSNNYKSNDFFNWMYNEQSKGAKHLSTISLWNNDEWVNVDDLPNDLKNCYLKGFNNEPLIIQGKIYLNILCPQLKERYKSEINTHIKAGTNGFVFDEVSGSTIAVINGEGSFDNYSIKGFNNYLINKYSEKYLKNNFNITNINSFNYYDFIVNNGYVNNFKQYWSNPAPLEYDYYDFLLKSTNDFIIELINYIKSINNSLIISANINPLYNQGFNELLDLFVYEHEWFPQWRKSNNYFNMSAGIPSTPSIKFAISNNKKAAVMPSLHDMDNFSTIERQLLFNHQLAETYSSGGYYMYFPDIIYDSINYSTPKKSIYPYYSFVRSNPSLFNNLTSYAEIAVLRPTVGSNADDTTGFSLLLTINNIPYDVINIDQVNNNYKVIITSGFYWSNKDFNTIYSFVNNGGILLISDNRFAKFNESGNIIINSKRSLLKSGSKTIIGKGEVYYYNTDVWFKLWAYMSNDSSTNVLNVVKKFINPCIAPKNVVVLPYFNGSSVIVHLINYDFKNGDFINKNGIITIPLPNNFTPNNITLLSPELNKSKTLKFDQSNNTLSFNIESLHIWDLIVIN